LVLLRFQPHFSGRGLAEDQELADLESELGERAVVDGFLSLSTVHINLYRSTI
jgi:hypothetical protein